jgi:hypothetical protein
MTEEEARSIIKAHHWTFKIRTRRRGTPYIYVARKQAGKIIERYICPLSKLDLLTKEQLTSKLI